MVFKKKKTKKDQRALQALLKKGQVQNDECRENESDIFPATSKKSLNLSVKHIHVCANEPKTCNMYVF